ncbi:MAG: restriction endonuclease subunit S [Chitinophagaceae bacterium]|nr:restriction endonuclease subunit S [Chitinophagaceae bacterium]
MRQGWEIKTLGDLVTIKTGKLDANAMVEGGKYPFFTCSREIYSIDNYAFDCEAILLAGNNASGDFNVKHFKGKFNAYQRTYIITVNNERIVLYKFLLHCLIDHLKVFKEQSVGANTKFLKLGMIQNVLIPLPPLSEQKRIVSILDRAFAAIDKAKANTERNLQNAKALFESYLQGVFEERGEDWEEKRLGEVCEYDKTQNKAKLPYVGLEHIESNTGKFLGSREPQSVKSSTFLFSQKHVLYGRLRPYLNKVLLPEFEGHCSTEIFPIIPGKNLDRRFLFYWFIKSDTVKEIDSTWTGARMPRANMNAVLDFKFYLPSLRQQISIVKNLQILFEQTQLLVLKYQQKLTSLDELKKSILQKAFSGQLTADARIYEKESEALTMAAERKAAYAPETTDKLTEDEWLQLYFMLINISFHNGKAEQKYLAEVKMEKSCHFGEKIIKQLHFNRNPFKAMNGPADFERLYKLHDFAEANCIFIYEKSASYKKYIEGENFMKYMGKAMMAFRPFIKKINELLAKLLPLNTDTIDLYATTYTAWNNLLMQKKEVNVKSIAKEGRWHQKKNRFTDKDFENAIEFLRTNDLVPEGNGKLVLEKSKTINS